jgi:16S rRNA (guanine966-N2)-methyltransferase
VLKITGGRLRGRPIQAPPGLATRPSASRLRQALFNILGPSVAGARVADLFAGSGCLGCEALSRGAAGCLFVEREPAACRLLQANLAALGLAGAGRVVKGDALAAHPALIKGAPYDLILADPPYERGMVAGVLANVVEGRLLAPEGRLVIEHSPRERPQPLQGLALLQTRAYGQSELSFFAP